MLNAPVIPARHHEILVVDDSQLSLELMSHILADHGYRVRTAPNGQIALLSVAGKPPDLILLDVTMPGMDGLEVCRRLKSNEASRDIPVLFISAQEETFDRVKGFEAGGLDYIGKSFQPMEILARIDVHLRLAELTQNLEERVRERTKELSEANANLLKEIKERVQTEESLRESNERFQSAFHDTPFPSVISTLEEGRLMDLNREAQKVLGFTRDESVGKTSIELGWLTESDRSRIIDKIHEDGHARDIELIVHAKSGQPVLCKYWGEIIRVDGKKRLLSICMDITEQRRVEQQLIQSQKMESIGRLAGGVAHDFNNMLSVILGHAELGLRDKTLAENQRKHFKEILDAGNRSAGITQQLLAFARQQNVEPQILDLNEKVSSILKMLKRLIGENIRLDWEPAHDLDRVKIDPAQIDQLLANLCINARDAITGIGRITLRTENVTLLPPLQNAIIDVAPGEYVMLSISNTGQGMSSDVLCQIFEPFYTTKERGKGTGLGLAIVYGIVRQNQGGITVESDPNNGSTFNIYLPAIAGKGQKDHKNMNLALERGSETILFVEDEPALIELGKVMLTSLGYRIITAATPEEAVKVAEIEKDALQLLITDVIMPGMNGIDLAKQLQTLSRRIKCIFISGYTSDVIAHQGAIREGIFIEKPFNFSFLAKKVREVLDS